MEASQLEELRCSPAQSTPPPAKVTVTRGGGPRGAQRTPAHSPSDLVSPGTGGTDLQGQSWSLPVPTSIPQPAESSGTF